MSTYILMLLVQNDCLLLAEKTQLLKNYAAFEILDFLSWKKNQVDLIWPKVLNGALFLLDEADFSVKAE